MRKLAILTVALLAALSAGVLAVTAGSGSSHREAPLSALDPTADDTDVYAFVAPDAPGSRDPDRQLDPVRGSGRRPELLPLRRPGVVLPQRRQHRRRQVRHPLPVQVQDQGPQPELVPLRVAGRELDQRSEAQPRADATRSGASATSAAICVSDKLLGQGPARRRRTTSGPRRSRTTTRSPTRRSSALPGGGKVFAGQVDDPFFVDLGIDLRRHQHRHAGPHGHRHRQPGRRQGRPRRLQRPHDRPAGARRPTSPATTRRRPTPRPATPSSACGPRPYRPLLQVTRQSPVASAAASSASERGQRVSDDHGEGQVSRLGNPLVNEVVIPLGQKDKFNATQPSDDLKNFGKYVLSPELAKVINVLFPGLNVPENNRTDIVQALLTGIPGLTQIAPSAPPTDTLKINLGVAAEPAARAASASSAGDTAGLPERPPPDRRRGRHLRCASWAASSKGNKLPLGDGVDQNDKPFRTSFPYVAAPDDGLRLAAQADRAGARAGPGDPPGRRWRRTDGRAGRRPRPLRAPPASTTSTRGHPPMRRLLISFVATFAVALAVFVLAARGGSPPRRDRAPRAAPAARADARRVHRRAHRRPAGRPSAPRPSAPTAATLLAGAYLQKVRETGDAGFYAARSGAVAPRARAAPRRPRRADRAQRARALAPRLPRPGCATRRAPARWRPTVVQPLGAVVDALVELGRYDAGRARAAGDGRPQAQPRRLRARVLLPRAARRPRTARSAPCALAVVRRRRGARAASPTCSALLGGLELAAAAASAPRVRAYREALAGACPATPAAEAGLAQADVARGRLGAGDRPAAARRRRGCRCPSYVIALGEAQAAAGRRAAAAQTFALVRVETMLQQRGRRQRRRRARPLRGRPRQPARGPWRSAAEPGRRRRAFARPTPWGGPCTAQGTRAPRSGGRGARWPSARATRPS